MRDTRLCLFLLSLLCLGSCKGQPQQADTLNPSFSNIKYLVKDTFLYDHLKFQDGNVFFYKNWEEKRDDIVECLIYKDEIPKIRQLATLLSPDSLLLFYQLKQTKKLQELPFFAKYAESSRPPTTKPDTTFPLKGLRVCLDPGHIEADMEMAQIEGKFIKMKPAPETGMVPISFNEANLTLATAKILAEMLRKEGVEVMITRPEAGIGLLGLRYTEWENAHFQQSLQDEMSAQRLDSLGYAYFKHEANREEKYQRLYVPIDLRLRAEKINRFQPDLTLIIHYNVHGPNWENRDEENNVPPTDKNYNMAFVAGSFKAGELKRIEERVAFMRLLFTQDLEKSIHLSDCLMQQFEKKLQVPAVSDADDLAYLRNSCILTEKKGVYARNLNLTRNIKGILCYGESLCQDNRTEAAWLNQRLVSAGDMMTSSRAKQVAEAYFEAIKQFARENKRQRPQ